MRRLDGYRSSKSRLSSVREHERRCFTKKAVLVETSVPALASGDAQPSATDALNHIINSGHVAYDPDCQNCLSIFEGENVCSSSVENVGPASTATKSDSDLPPRRKRPPKLGL